MPEADICVYDNNSTDNTDEIARKAGAIHLKEDRYFFVLYAHSDFMYLLINAEARTDIANLKFCVKIKTEIADVAHRLPCIVYKRNRRLSAVSALLV